MINIKAIQPSLKLSTAAGAVGAWSSNWWGGNLKGLWYNVKQVCCLSFFCILPPFLPTPFLPLFLPSFQPLSCRCSCSYSPFAFPLTLIQSLHCFPPHAQWYPDLIDFMGSSPNAGGINVMTYDLSDNPEFHECPDESDCTLDKQVAFYMKTYSDANIPASVGYEIGVPAYPAPDHDAQHQLPLTHEMLASIVSQTQPQFKSAFFWELFKDQNQTSYASPTQVAQALCSTLLHTSRCTGVLPNVTTY
jgi:hypothetical protein